jgi:hypothetical protein
MLEGNVYQGFPSGRLQLKFLSFSFMRENEKKKIKLVYIQSDSRGN